MEKNPNSVGEVSELCIYPVKSARVLNITSAQCTEVGLYLPQMDIYDRQYCFLMPNGKAASMKQIPKLTLIRTSVEDDTICLDAPDLPTLKLPKNVEGRKEDVRQIDVLECHSEGVDCGDEAGEWISRHLNKSGVRLVRFTDTHAKRTLGQREEILREWGVELPEENPKLTFPDFGPYTMLSEESVADLNTRLENPVSAKNFRPNIVIKGCKPYEEDTLTKVRIASAEFRFFTNDPRCSVTTVDPETAVRYPKFAPLTTLREYRPFREMKGVKWPFFAIYMVLTKPGEIKVGDIVYKLE